MQNSIPIRKRPEHEIINGDIRIPTTTKRIYNVNPNREVGFQLIRVTQHYARFYGFKMSDK